MPLEVGELLGVGRPVEQIGQLVQRDALGEHLGREADVDRQLLVLVRHLPGDDLHAEHHAEVVRDQDVVPDAVDLVGRPLAGGGIARIKSLY